MASKAQGIGCSPIQSLLGGFRRLAGKKPSLGTNYATRRATPSTYGEVLHLQMPYCVPWTIDQPIPAKNSSMRWRI